MTQSPSGGGVFSPSVDEAMLWAQACAALGGIQRPVGSDEVFLGIMLAHPDGRGEMRRFLAHFGLTARDVLPDDYPLITSKRLQQAAATVQGPEVSTWSIDVNEILSLATRRGAGVAQVAHVMGALLLHPTPWRDRLQRGLSRFGIPVDEVAREFDQLLPGLPDETEVIVTSSQIDLASGTTAGEQIGSWLQTRFPRQPATFAAFASDDIDPDSDFVGVSVEADAFAYLIASKALAPPLAIGLFGLWGSGKSFLMRKVDRRVEQLTGLAAGNRAADLQVWGKVATITFNAWQYVETDLWAALLYRIFDKLSPEARQKLSEYDKAKKKAQQQASSQAAIVTKAEKAVAALALQETTDADEADAAEVDLNRAQQQAAEVRTVLMTQALERSDRALLDGQVAAATSALLGQQTADALTDARHALIAARTAPWAQPAFWSRRRRLRICLAVAVVPLVVYLLQLWGASALTALTAALATAVPMAIAGLRAVATFAQHQQLAYEKAERDVDNALKSTVDDARAKAKEAADALKKTRQRLSSARDDAATASAVHAELRKKAAELTVGGMLTDFLSERRASLDYRKRLGPITTAYEDLRKLEELTDAYNAERRPSDDPPGPNDPPNRIVLYIDDLDRCPPTRVVEVLEAVHLLLAFKLFVVIVAVDTRWLTESLSTALPISKKEEDAEGKAATAIDYLEKIFQIPFWIEPLDDDSRQSLMRGLLLPSVAVPTDAGAAQTGASVQVGEPESDLVGAMLSKFGTWLDLDAQKFTITPEELQFIERLSPLIVGTPRQVKRFVNVCQFLLAMAPPLSRSGDPPTERMAACFMAALQQAMPELAERIARAAESAASDGADTTVREALDAIDATALVAEREHLNAWLAASQAADPAGRALDDAQVAPFAKRWDVIRRMRFEAAQPLGPSSAAQHG